MLSIESVYAGYGEVKILNNISLTIPSGQTTALLGPNGAGKTTLIRAICRMIPLTSGRISLNGVELSTLPAHRVSVAGISLVPEGRGVLYTLTVLENLELGAINKTVRRQLKNRLECILEVFPDLKAKLHHVAGSLSGGQQQMMVIGRALMSFPKVLILDEPSLGLSPLLVQTVYESLVKIQNEEKLTILLAEQNAMNALEIASQVYFMDHGEITRSGEPALFKNDSTILSAYFGA
ncbi:ABC transporter ATP-binding protein [Fodinisporobacter ferrooxydans]|uniref:ABC transporter ATP-binding protein n=1 Tax=Fodinisporobacter ferrooxydans TaxID=2901836 RepID=A0ABY4CKL2_9BACL|nr:ABC transporter ATP-binding protein [Alicyclobacillaceae bacterium MYW30-H2]